MTDRLIKCPACERLIQVPPDSDLAGLSCPHCESELAPADLQSQAERAQELAPGFRPGQRIGNYMIEEFLGAGGMAVVFRGTQLSLNRKVAIKVLPHQYTRKKLFVQRFESEAAVLASLNHPNIVNVIDRGREDDTYYIVMEFVEGESLKERIQRRGRLTSAEIIPIAEQVLAGLAYAHRRGVVHRDIKPGNIMITHDDMVKIADFGLAHLAKGRGGLDVTRENQSMGTLKYMAPEQLASAKNVDGRADLYSFGVCLYEMLTGKLPIGAFKMPTEEDRTLDARWDDVITRALRMDPNERYQTADEMAAAIRSIATSPPLTAAEREAADESSLPRLVPEKAWDLACAKCGHESAPDALSCESCGESLLDLFDECPRCRKMNRLDVATCRNCGADLESRRAERRREAEAIQTRAKELASRKDYDAALAEVAKLAAFTSREYAALRESAERWKERIREKKERFRTRRYEAGCRAIAEKQYEQALQLWEGLPDNYKDVGARRREILALRETARAALLDGQKRFRAKDYEGAIRSFEKAQTYWVHDKDLKDAIVKAQIRLGNERLKAGYLRDAVAAQKKGDTLQARALCERILALDPDDSTAMRLIEEIGSGVSDSSIDAEYASDILLPARRRSRKRLSPIVITAIVIGTLGLVIAVVISCITITGRRRAREAAAASIFTNACNLRIAGDLDAARKSAERVVREYPDTTTAPDAKRMIAQIDEMRRRSNELRMKAEEAAKPGDEQALALAYRLYRQALDDPAVKADKWIHEHACRRADEIREQVVAAICRRAQELAGRGSWREALAEYERARSEYDYYTDPVASGIAAARQRIEQAEAEAQRAKLLLERKEWKSAIEAARSALALLPDNPPALRVLDRAGAGLSPPEGTVFVPAGDYLVGGIPGRPERRVSLPVGFYIQQREVTLIEYDRFMRATRRVPPRGWRILVGTEDLPVSNITWHDAQAYAAWWAQEVSRSVGIPFQGRLPTEDEWECAARGDAGRRFPWGADLAGDVVLAFGPAPVGTATKDRSPLGCLDMAGNVAEWTCTPDPADPAGARCIVKGNSWAGLERDRPIPIVPCSPQTSSDQIAWVLVQHPASPDISVDPAHPVGVEIYYLGAQPTRDHVKLLVRQWMPTWGAWAEGLFDMEFRPGTPIERTIKVPVRRGSADKRRETETVVFRTGCTLSRHEPDVSLEILDPFSIPRTLARTSVKISDEIEVSTVSQPRATGELSLADVVRSASRMSGRKDLRYLNVGFRCVLPLWEPPSATRATQAPSQ